MCSKVQKESQSDSPYFTTFYGDLLGPFHGQNITEVESIHHNTTFSLVYKSHHYQQSLVTLTFAADSVSFVENRCVYVHIYIYIGMNNHFPSCYAYSVIYKKAYRELNLERAESSLLHWARQLYLGISPFISNP